MQARTNYMYFKVSQTNNLIRTSRFGFKLIRKQDTIKRIQPSNLSSSIFRQKPCSFRWHCMFLHQMTLQHIFSVHLCWTNFTLEYNSWMFWFEMSFGFRDVRKGCMTNWAYRSTVGHFAEFRLYTSKLGVRRSCNISVWFRNLKFHNDDTSTIKATRIAHHTTFRINMQGHLSFHLFILQFYKFWLTNC